MCKASWSTVDEQAAPPWRWLPLPYEIVVNRFRRACESGSAATLSALLAPDVRAIVDDGGKLRTAVRSVCGVAEATTAVLELLAGRAISVHSVNGRAGLVVRSDGRVAAVAAFCVRAGLIKEIWLVINPDKLRHWN